jgi:hypothetical protein
VIQKPKTHFEQVPLEIVRKILEEDGEQEIATEQVRVTKKKSLQAELLGAPRSPKAGGRTWAIDLTSLNQIRMVCAGLNRQLRLRMPRRESGNWRLFRPVTTFFSTTTPGTKPSWASIGQTGPLAPNQKRLSKGEGRWPRGLRFPNWQSPLQEAILESDRNKLFEKIQRVEALIFDRLLQLRQDKNAHKEDKAINDAVEIPRTITRDSLSKLLDTAHELTAR